MTMKVSGENIKELATRAPVVKMFRQFDTNGDGVIDRNELGNILTHVDKSWTPDRLDRLFRVVDMNEDGFIDYEEFLIWIFATPKVDTKDLRAFRDAAKRLSAGAIPSAHSPKGKSKGKQVSETLAPKFQVPNLAINATQLPRAATEIQSSQAMIKETPESETIEPAKQIMEVQQTLEPETMEPARENNISPAPPVVPAKPVNLRVMSMIGNEIGTIDGIEIASTTGHCLKSTISSTYGFPSFNMKLILATGDMIDNSLLSSQACFCEVADSCGDDYLPVSCVLSTAQPLGEKEKGKRLRPFGSKAGMLLEHRINSSSAPGLVSTLKVPDASFRDDAQRLITASFAPHLASLIDVGFNAAFHSEGADDLAVELAGASEVFTYIDSVHKVSADLSTCRLWVGMVTLEAFPWLADMWKHESHEYECSYSDQAFGNVASAVLWRLIFGWEGGGGAAQAGPVLEVLFLATHPAMREGGQATKLVKELEKGAMAMGCSAIAVAAVPSQGIRFWNRCGYEVAVPLGHEGPGQTVSALGDFLLENMLLFTDTPLVAKVLA